MSPKNDKGFVRISAAALAAVIGIGGLGFQPSAQAAEPTASSPVAASLSYLSDPIRIDLIHLNDMKDTTFILTQSYNYDDNPYASKYYNLIKIQDKAYTMAMDPAASQAELSALKREYEQTLQGYIDQFLADPDISKHFATMTFLLYYSDRIGEDESKLTPAERAELHAIWDAQDYAEQLGRQLKGSYIRAYKEVYLPKSAVGNDLDAYEPSQYRQLASGYRADIQARLNALNGSAANHAASVNAFERAASLLEQLATSGYNLNQVQMAAGNLEVRYKALVEELKQDSPIKNSEEYRKLAEGIEVVWKTMDSPKGIGPGQYPQSAFGDLRRALRKAERVLKIGKTLDELKAASSELADAQMEFLMRKKPGSVS